LSDNGLPITCYYFTLVLIVAASHRVAEWARIAAPRREGTARSFAIMDMNLRSFSRYVPENVVRLLARKVSPLHEESTLLQSRHAWIIVPLGPNGSEHKPASHSQVFACWGRARGRRECGDNLNAVGLRAKTW
jgi:hypothetical protein